ncbi:MAG: secretin and TonB N-terminal domain-containing protein [Planctomycetia bacterium]|nr:MAG: secretin and TonB N-terminal domain-containing protein [Planctomycetia bacterium]
MRMLLVALPILLICQSAAAPALQSPAEPSARVGPPDSTAAPASPPLEGVPPDLLEQVRRVLGAPAGSAATSTTPSLPAESPPPLRLSPGASQPITPALGGARPTAVAGAVEEAAQDRVAVGTAGRLDVRFFNTELFLALEALGEQTGRNIVLQPGATGTVSLTLRDVTFEQALDAVLRANDLESTIRDGVVFVRPARKADAEPSLDMRMFRLSYVPAPDVEEFIKPLISTHGRMARTPAPKAGIGSSKDDAGGMSPAMGDVLIVVDQPDRLAIIEQAIAEIDAPPQQVLVEATIMRATLNEQNALGIEFNTLAGVDFQMLAGNSPGVGSLSLGPVPQPQLQNTSVAARTEFNSAIPAGGFTFGVVKDQVASFIRALEQITDVTILANPKVLTLNKQRGEIIVGRRDGYLTTTVTETAAVQTVEFLETGTRLIFRPFVTRDGFVRMEIHPEDSNGGLTAANLPFQETTEATTNIVIRNGHTILIGGLFRERSTVGKSQIPGLGSIPILGVLLGNNQNSTVREEVIILLTVHVLEPGAADADAEALYEDAERMRVAQRSGLSGLGRDHLAEAHYQAAVGQVRAGSIGAAIFNLRLSTGLRPRHADAVRLLERLTRDRTWQADGSLIRGHLRHRVRGEPRPADRGAFGRPLPIAPPEQQPKTRDGECAERASRTVDAEAARDEEGSDE